MSSQPVNPNIINYCRLRSEEDKYCDYKSITILCGTYNVNGKACTNVKLKNWLFNKHIKDPPDIYAVGFQELDLSQQAFFFGSTPREDEWATGVKLALHGGGHYVEVKRVRLVGIFLLVYIKKHLLEFIGDLDANMIGTGFLNRMGNKGGVAIRLKIYDSSICFITSHLAAGADELLRRNQDFKEVCKMRFPINNFDIFDHDLVFWMGDLNYRLYNPQTGANLETSYVKRKCLANEYDLLLKFDQLTDMRKKKVAFHEFNEGKIRFPPTYKYDPGTDNWDSSEKCRAPAWTDRILWIGDHTRQIFYESVPDLKISDHKPVTCLFKARLKKIDPVRIMKVFQSSLREENRLENEHLPQAEVNNLELRFPLVKFLEPQSQNIVIKNTGQTPLRYTFKPKDSSNKEYCKPWILVTPDSFLVKIGAECDITVTVLVDKLSVHKIMTGVDNFEDILVLHLDGGKDFFLTISATFFPTCFGQPLANLLTDQQQQSSSFNMIKDDSTVPVAQLIDLGFDAGEPVQSVKSVEKIPGVPNVLYRLVDNILQHGLETFDLFAEPGSQSDFLKIRDLLDAGGFEPLPGTVYSVVETLMRFLDTLPESVIPDRYFEFCCRHCSDFPMCQKIISQLPFCNRSVFLYLIDFLKKLLGHGHKDSMTANSLAILFAPFLLRTGEISHTISISREANKIDCAVQFVQNFILFDQHQ